MPPLHRQATHCIHTAIRSPTSKSIGFLAQHLRWNERVKGCSKKKEKKRKKQNPKNEMGLHILNWVWRRQEGWGTDDGFSKEVRAQSIAPPLAPLLQEGSPPEERLQNHRVAPQRVSPMCSSHLVWHQHFGSRSYPGNKFFPENLSHAVIQSCQNHL